ncbi:hypothetical protein N657DRAFT_697519 [Parathielavia appendiculata]|uniref:Uncharacterized protein n=1 Tax=Parathielavia appendiculata TaxID=2587402 RepID=A0AAN6UDG7_9PEZI|nr:hypothetical protein N657DRAFT_697519 [Parathielavia appendiculata]
MRWMWTELRKIRTDGSPPSMRTMSPYFIYRDGDRCSIFQPRLHGSFNVCFSAEFDSPLERWAIRIPIPATLPGPCLTKDGDRSSHNAVCVGQINHSHSQSPCLRIFIHGAERPALHHHGLPRRPQPEGPEVPVQRDLWPYQLCLGTPDPDGVAPLSTAGRRLRPASPARVSPNRIPGIPLLGTGSIGLDLQP